MTNKLVRWALAAITAMCGCASARAQVAYQIGTSTPVQPGTADFTIDLGSVDANTTIRIFDAGQVTGQPPTVSAGRITIAGSLASGSSAIVSIFLASQFDPESFVDPTDQPDRGLVNLSTLTVTDPLLRDRTRAIISLAGNLTGDPLDPANDHVVVGQVFRLDAAGTVTGNIFAGALDGSLGGGFQSVEFLRAASLSGNVRVADAVVSTDLRSIRTVRVFDQAGTGIRGSIRADRIGTVWTAGPIGTQEELVTIEGFKSIGEVRAVNETGSMELDRDFFVAATVSGPPFDFENLPRAERIKTLGNIAGTIDGSHWEFIEAGGDISATVRSLNVGRLVDAIPAGGGMFAGGSITGIVDVGDAGLVVAMVAGGDITSPVISGHMLLSIRASGSISSQINTIFPLSDLPFGSLGALEAGSVNSTGNITGSITTGDCGRSTAFGHIDAPIYIEVVLSDRIVATSMREPIVIGRTSWGVNRRSAALALDS
ncbi:MAG: hypothetical protein IT438_11995 [Phycisphaerales bacterium]|nr:hypothetical protein [Phycisphaerales bacterium]